VYAYPTNIREEIGVVLDAVRNPSKLATKETVQAVWVVAGYALSFGFGSEPPVMHGGPDVPAICRELERKLSTVEGAGVHAVDWASIVPLLVRLLAVFFP
jgi:hypothetical protein